MLDHIIIPKRVLFFTVLKKNVFTESIIEFTFGIYEKYYLIGCCYLLGNWTFRPLGIFFFFCGRVQSNKEMD